MLSKHRLVRNWSGAGQVIGNMKQDAGLNSKYREEIWPIIPTKKGMLDNRYYETELSRPECQPKFSQMQNIRKKNLQWFQPKVEFTFTFTGVGVVRWVNWSHCDCLSHKESLIFTFTSHFHFNEFSQTKFHFPFH